MLVKRFLFFIQKQMSFEVNATVHSLESPSGLRQLFFWLLGMLAAESSQENPSPGTAFA